MFDTTAIIHNTMIAHRDTPYYYIVRHTIRVWICVWTPAQIMLAFCEAAVAQSPRQIHGPTYLDEEIIRLRFVLGSVKWTELVGVHPNGHLPKHPLYLFLARNLRHAQHVVESASWAESAFVKRISSRRTLDPLMVQAHPQQK